MSHEPGTTPPTEPTPAEPHGLAAQRLALADAGALDPGGAAEERSPRVVDTAVTSLGSCDVGLWQLDPGVVHDVEVDEVFLVLAGAATVTFDDGSVLALRPGVLVQLRAGDRTVWEVTETLRKLYVAASD